MTDSDRSPPGPENTLSTVPVRLLAIGDLVATQGHARLLDVFAGVVHWNPYARLLIVGDGPEREALEAQIHALGLDACVGLPGRVDRPSLAEWTQRAHVFVSAAQPAPGMDPALPAAMASGLCIVATDGGSAERVVADGVSGLLVPPDDEMALSRALHLAVANAELRQRLGEAAAASIRGGGLRKSA